jgi:hypothetical protein
MLLLIRHSFRGDNDESEGIAAARSDYRTRKKADLLAG